MGRCTRRSAMVATAAALLGIATRAKAAPPSEHRDFIDAAFKMKAEAVRLGDQPFGAVVVKDGRIIGYGPSRVILKQDTTAHAELGTTDLSGCLLYSTSRPCAACERAAAHAQIARMIHGADATDAGPPR